MFADVATEKKPFKGKVSVDGYPAAGKTTMAGLISQKLDLIHLDSGACYRALTLNCMNKGIDFNNPDEIIDTLRYADIRLSRNRVFLNEKDVSQEIRTVEVTNSVRFISHIPEVRSFVTGFQHFYAQAGGIISDGRKVGTEVFPDADVKFFMTADLNVRAYRRFLQQRERTPEIRFTDVLHDLKRREEYELENNILICPENAVIIDNTNMSIEETLEKMISYIV